MKALVMDRLTGRLVHLIISLQIKMKIDKEDEERKRRD